MAMSERVILLDQIDHRDYRLGQTDQKDYELGQIRVVALQPLTEQVEIAPTIDLQTILPSPNKLIDQVTVLPVTAEIDSQIVPTNIRAGVSILGVQGNLEPDKPDQTKTVTPSEVEQRVVADTGYELGMCVVAPIPTNYLDTSKPENVYAGQVEVVE